VGVGNKKKGRRPLRSRSSGSSVIVFSFPLLNFKHFKFVISVLPPSNPLIGLLGNDNKKILHMHYIKSILQI